MVTCKPACGRIFLYLWGPFPGVKFQGGMVSLCLTSQGNCQAVLPTSVPLIFPARRVGSSPAPTAVCLLKNVGSCSSFILPVGVYVHVPQVMLDGLCIFKCPLAGRRPRPLPTLCAPVSPTVPLAGGYFP